MLIEKALRLLENMFSIDPDRHAVVTFQMQHDLHGLTGLQASMNVIGRVASGKVDLFVIVPVGLALPRLSVML